jgi:hypothetical protein
VNARVRSRFLSSQTAGIDPDTKAPRRRVARMSELRIQVRPPIDLLADPIALRPV